MDDNKTYTIEFFAKDPDGEDYTDQVGHTLQLTESPAFIQGMLLRAASIGHNLQDVISIKLEGKEQACLDALPIGESVQVESVAEAAKVARDGYGMFLDLGQGMQHFDLLPLDTLHGFAFCADNLELEAQFAEPDYLFLQGEEITDLAEHLQDLGDDGDSTVSGDIVSGDIDLSIQEIADRMINGTAETARFAAEILAANENMNKVNEETKQTKTAILVNTDKLRAEIENILENTSRTNKETEEIVEETKLIAIQTEATRAEMAKTIVETQEPFYEGSPLAYKKADALRRKLAELTLRPATTEMYSTEDLD